MKKCLLSPTTTMVHVEELQTLMVCLISTICVFDEAKGEYSDLYRLTPIAQDIFELAKEDWSIWKRWESAFHSGNATRESHPALPQDKARHEKIRAILDAALTTDATTCVIQRGSFERLGSAEHPKGVLRPLEVKWTEVGG